MIEHKRVDADGTPYLMAVLCRMPASNDQGSIWIDVLSLNIAVNGRTNEPRDYRCSILNALRHAGSCDWRVICTRGKWGLLVRETNLPVP